MVVSSRPCRLGARPVVSHPTGQVPKQQSAPVVPLPFGVLSSCCLGLRRLAIQGPDSGLRGSGGARGSKGMEAFRGTKSGFGKAGNSRRLRGTQAPGDPGSRGTRAPALASWGLRGVGGFGGSGRFRMEEAAQAAGWQRELLGQAGHLPETLQYGISSFVYRSSRPFHPLRLWAAALEPSSPSAALSRSHANGADVALSGFQGGPMADVACAGSGGDGGDGQVSGVASSGLGGGGQAASGTLSHDGSQGGATTAVPRRSLPAVLRSKGFFSLAPQPEVVWEWSTVGHDKRFRPYGRWAPPSPSPGDSSGTTTSKPCVAPSLATNNAKPASKRGAEPRQPARLGGIAAGGGEEGEAGGRQPQQRGDFFEQRLVFIGADVEEVRLPTSACSEGRNEWMRSLQMN